MGDKIEFVGGESDTSALVTTRRITEGLKEESKDKLEKLCLARLY